MSLQTSYAKGFGLGVFFVVCTAVCDNAAAKADNKCGDGGTSVAKCFDNRQDHDYRPSNRSATTSYIATDSGSDDEWDTHALVTLALQPIDPSSNCVAPPTEITIPGTPGMPGHTVPVPPTSFPFPQPLVASGNSLFIQTLNGVTMLYLFGKGSSVTRPVTKNVVNGRITYLAALSPGTDGDFYDYFVKFRSEPPIGAQNKRKKNYVVEAFYSLHVDNPLDDCDQERPDQDNSGVHAVNTSRQPGTGQGNEPVH